MRPASCQQVSLVPRGLDPLPREKAVDRDFVHAKDAPDADCVEPTAVNQTSNRFRVNAELSRYFTDAVEGVGPWVWGRHEDSVPRSRRFRYGPTGSWPPKMDLREPLPDGVL